MLVCNPKLTGRTKKKIHFLGFTLIEVLTALMILSITVIALSTAASQSTRNVSQLRQKQFANWIAHNQMSLYLLGRSSQNQGQKRYAGIDYFWEIKTSSTQTANFRKVTINISSLAAKDYTLATTTAFQGTL